LISSRISRISRESRESRENRKKLAKNLVVSEKVRTFAPAYKM